MALRNIILNEGLAGWRGKKSTLITKPLETLDLTDKSQRMIWFSPRVQKSTAG
jgi:hypothetical protein